MNDSTAEIGSLFPSCNRASALAVTLTALRAQTLRRFRVIISDQSTPGHVQGRPFASGEVRAALQVLLRSKPQEHACNPLP